MAAVIAPVHRPIVIPTSAAGNGARVAPRSPPPSTSAVQTLSLIHTPPLDAMSVPESPKETPLIYPQPPRSETPQRTPNLLAEIDESRDPLHRVPPRRLTRTAAISIAAATIPAAATHFRSTPPVWK